MASVPLRAQSLSQARMPSLTSSHMRARIWRGCFLYAGSSYVLPNTCVIWTTYSGACILKATCLGNSADRNSVPIWTSQHGRRHLYLECQPRSGYLYGYIKVTG